MTEPSGPRSPRPPLWRDIRVLRIAGQIVFGGLVAAAILYLYGNLISNLQRQGIVTDYAFLRRPAGFAIAGADFRSNQPVLDAILVGVKNTALVAAVGIVLATVIGVLVGIARLSTNWLVRTGAAIYVESLRNIPVLVIIIFMFTAVTLRLPSLREPITGPGVVVANAGLWIPWFTTSPGIGGFWLTLVLALVAAAGVAWWRTRRFDRTGRPHRRVLWATGTFFAVAAAGYLAAGRPLGFDVPVLDVRRVRGGFHVIDTYAALLVALTIYTASHIAEIVRGSILAVPHGQNEAAAAVGLSSFQRMRFVVLPQAMRIAIPPVANQYLNLTKNSSLGIAIGFAEATAVTQVAIGQGNPAPQLIAILMSVYLVFSLLIAGTTNLLNRRMTLGSR